MIFYTFINLDASASEQHAAAHRLLDFVLRRKYGIEKYTLGYAERGKPFVENYPDIFFNLSHCTGLAVCAVSEAEIGVDAELIRLYNGNASKRIFTKNEMLAVSESDDPNEAFFRFWTLKEALGKAFGTGIFSNLKEYEFSLKNGLPFCGSAPKKIFTQKKLCVKWILSVCSEVPESIFEEISF